MTRSDLPSKGLRPVLGSACRVVLREAIPSPVGSWSAETTSHVEACVDCQARVRAAGRLATWLADAPRPVLPEAMAGRASEILDGIHERFVEAAESGPLGAWVLAADVAMPEAATDCAEAVVGDRALLASRLMTEPAAPVDAVWSQVRRSILDTVALSSSAQSSLALDAVDATADGARASARPSTVRWRILFAGAAASVAIGFFAVASGGFATGGSSPGDQLPFVVVDLGRAPDMDYAVARFGLRH